LWNLEGQLLADLNKHKDIVKSAVFSPDGRRILTASGDGTAKLWLTPVGIYEWLKTAEIPGLSADDKKNLEIQ
jgi:WD40 repeat protein